MVRPSSRSAIDGACAEVFCCANIVTPEYRNKQQYYETAEQVTGSDEVVFLYVMSRKFSFLVTTDD